MSLIKELLLEKKLIEVSEEIDAFLEKNEIGSGSYLQRIDFDGDIYENMDQVNDFLKAHWLDHMAVDETPKGFSAMMYDEIGFIPTTLKSIEIRDGVMVVVGQLRHVDTQDHMGFKLSSESMKFSERLPSIIEIAKVIKGFHASYGKVEITKQHLRKFKENFENNACGVDVSIDFDHESREAAGWLREVYLSEDESKLYGVVRWTPKGALSLNDREFRYFSPEFTLNFVHPHSGIVYGPTLTGGALVNKPFLKMDAIVGLKDKQLKGESQMETIALSDHNAKVNGLEKSISDLKLSENTLKSELEVLKNEKIQLSDEVKGLKAKMIKKEMDEKHQKLFDEGKINKAQLVALKEGKDLLEVLSLSEKMNTTPAGEGSTVDGKITLSDAEMDLCKKMGLTPEEYIKFNEGGQ